MSAPAVSIDSLRFAWPGQSAFGLFPGLDLFNAATVYLLLAVAAVGCLVGLIPAPRIYRYSLIDGMTVRT